MKKGRIFLRIGIFYMILNIFHGVAICSADTTIGVTLATQEHSNWCWAASSKMVLDYYSSVQTQCAIANWAWGRSDCCGNSEFNWSHTCNQSNCMYGGSGCIDNILSHWGVSSVGQSSVFSQDTVVSEINGCRPFVMRFGWTGGGGHFLVSYGYDTSGTYVDYMDPWPGNGVTKKLYTWVVSASDHTWTHTLKITTPHVCTSCPSLWYSSDGEDFVRLSSIFIGAVGSAEEYRDYILLKDIVPSEGKYIFQIRETYPEDSYMDMVKLIAVDHGADVDLNDLFEGRSHSPNLYYFNAPELLGLKMRMLSPLSAVYTSGQNNASSQDVTDLLYWSDNAYVPLSEGDIISLTFKELPLLDEKRSFIFIGEGYYNRLSE